MCVVYKLVSSMNTNYEIRYVTRADKLGNFQRCKVHSHSLKGGVGSIERGKIWLHGWAGTNTRSL